MKYARYYAIVSEMKQLGVAESDNLSNSISSFSKTKSSSIKDLSPFEYNELCNYLSAHLRAFKSELAMAHVPKVTSGSVLEQKKNNMRRKIIALMCKIGYVKDGRADMEAIEHWCVSHSAEHKQLNLHSYDELVALTTQVESYYRSHISRI